MNNKATSEIVYNGKITVKIKKGKKVLKTTTYKNHGGLKLWEFLCGCIAGNYSSVNPIRPAQIRLYQNNSSDVPTSETDIWNTSLLTSLIYTNDRVDVLPNTEDTKSAVIHFIVTSTSINIAENTKINQIALFPSNYKDGPDGGNVNNDKENYSAVFLLTKPGEDRQEEWDPIDIESLSGNFVITIDWQLTFTNN